MAEKWIHSKESKKVDVSLVKGIESRIYFKHGFGTNPFDGAEPQLLAATLQVRPADGGVVHIDTQKADGDGNWDLDDPENSWVEFPTALTLDLGVDQHEYDIILQDSAGEEHMPQYGDIRFDALIPREDDDLSALADTTRLITANTCLNTRRLNLIALQISCSATGTTTPIETPAGSSVLNVYDASMFADTDTIGILNAATGEAHETTVFGAPSGNQITLYAALPSAWGTLLAGSSVYKEPVGESAL